MCEIKGRERVFDGRREREEGFLKKKKGEGGGVKSLENAREEKKRKEKERKRKGF